MSAPAALFLRRFLLLVLLGSAAGCGRIGFISDRYDNFTAYYNTFYNAERSYREAVDALDRTTEPIDRQVYISVFPAPGRAINDQKFQAAIDKSADVLRDHPDSKWVDDALVLIGKSYYYQHNFPGAEQKFREAIDRVSVLEDEARLWLARTLINSGAYDEAGEHLLQSLNRDDLSDRWEPSLRLAMGELHVKLGSFAEAVDELKAGLGQVRDNDLEARGWFLLGQVLETLGQYAESASAYEQVTGAHPRYELAYAAQLSAVRVKGMYVDSESALREIRRMERDDKNYTNRYELAFIRGRIYQAEGYAGDARSLYESILYDSEDQIGDVRPRIHFALGELYRDAFRDYEMASAHFDTARSALQVTASSRPAAQQGTPLYAPEALTNASDLAEMFGSFAGVRRQISEMDSLLYLGTLDEEEFAAKILEIRTRMAEELAEQERRAERMQAARGFQNAGTASDVVSRQRSVPAQNEAMGSAGFLFHRDPLRVQDGRMNFIVRWGERPHAPNWRRLNAIDDATASTDSPGELPQQQLRDLDPSVGEDPLPPIDYSDVPRDSLSRAALRARRAAARYELANVLFLSMEQADSAAYWYRLVIEEDDDFPVAQRAFYALAELHRSLGDTAAATRLYEEVLRDYPDSDFAGRVREQLGIREDVPSDTLALAEEDYDEAFQRWRRGSYRDAMNRMVEVAATYPRIEVAPRALLAAGRIFLEWADRDALDVFGPLPLTVADSVLEEAGLQPPAEESSHESDDVETELMETADSAAVEESTFETDSTGMADSTAAEASADTPEKLIVPAAEDRLAEIGVEDSSDGAVESDPPEPSAAGGERADSTREQRAADDERSGSQPDSTIAAEEEDPDERLTLVPDTLTEHTTNGPDSSSVPDGALTFTQSAVVADSSGYFDAAAADTSATERLTPEHDEIYLETLYRGVKENYPQTSYAPVADQMLRALQDRRLELRAAADSAATAAAAHASDSLALDDGFVLDSTLVERDGFVLDSTLVEGDGIVLDSTLAEGDGIVLDSTLAEGEDRLPDSTLAEGDGIVLDSTLAEGENRLLDSAQVPSKDARIDSMEAESKIVSQGDSVPDPSYAEGQAGDSDSIAVPLPDPPDNVESFPTLEKNPETGFPRGENTIRAEGGIRSELGGYTLVLASDTDEEPMTRLAAKYAEKGFRTDVLVAESDGRIVYCAVMGHFETLREGGSMMQKYASQIEESPQLTPVRDLE